MKTPAQLWDELHQTDRLRIMNGFYLATGPIDVVACSHSPFDELPDQVQNDLTSLTWKL